MKKITVEQGEKLIQAFQNLHDTLKECVEAGTEVPMGQNAQNAFDDPQQFVTLEGIVCKIESLDKGGL